MDDLNNMFEFFKLKNGFDRVSVPKMGTFCIGNDILFLFGMFG